jgi:hypothetical protein
VPCLPAGGEGAPNLQETLQNFGINAAALAVLGFFVYRDVSAQQKDQAVILREEALARLQVRQRRLQPGRVLPSLPAVKGVLVLIVGQFGCSVFGLGTVIRQPLTAMLLAVRLEADQRRFVLTLTCWIQ